MGSIWRLALDNCLLRDMKLLFDLACAKFYEPFLHLAHVDLLGAFAAFYILLSWS